jgi:aryl-alcohol dehydrogenase-like predicted oxidoreductase
MNRIMEYRNLGSTGLKVSELCLGTMQFGWTADEQLSHQILDAAFEAGINFIDTADIYSSWVEGNPGGVSEQIIGRWMNKSSIPREKLMIATKVRGRMGEGPHSEGLSKAHIFDAVEGSLRRLGTDYIDLYQSHWYDENTPIDETLSAFDDLVRQGKVRYIGASNYPAWRLTEAIWVARMHNLVEYQCLQPHYNLVHRAEFERELAEVCRAYGLGVIPYSPLAAGFLTGKYRPNQIPSSVRQGRASRYFNERNWELLNLMQKIGRDRNGFSISQVALAWLLSDPLISSLIIGPRTLDQLNDNLGAVGLRLTEDERHDLDQLCSWNKQD